MGRSDQRQEDVHRVFGHRCEMEMCKAVPDHDPYDAEAEPVRPAWGDRDPQNEGTQRGQGKRADSRQSRQREAVVIRQDDQVADAEQQIDCGQRKADGRQGVE